MILERQTTIREKKVLPNNLEDAIILSFLWAEFFKKGFVPYLLVFIKTQLVEF